MIQIKSSKKILNLHIPQNYLGVQSVQLSHTFTMSETQGLNYTCHLISTSSLHVPLQRKHFKIWFRELINIGEMQIVVTNSLKCFDTLVPTYKSKIVKSLSRSCPSSWQDQISPGKISPPQIS